MVAPFLQCYFLVYDIIGLEEIEEEKETCSTFVRQVHNYNYNYNDVEHFCKQVFKRID